MKPAGDQSLSKMAYLFSVVFLFVKGEAEIEAVREETTRRDLRNCILNENDEQQLQQTKIRAAIVQFILTTAIFLGTSVSRSLKFEILLIAIVVISADLHLGLVELDTIFRTHRSSATISSLSRR